MLLAGGITVRILIDAMGGDYSPQEIVKGAVMAAADINETLVLIGPTGRIMEELDKEGWSGNNIEIVDAQDVISNDESPAMAVRKKKDATITKGMNLLKDGDVDIFISAGSTGALLSAGLIMLGRIKGIKRPAIAAFLPQIGKDNTTLLLDCGANVETKPEHILQNGIMGSVFLSCVKGVQNPTVKLLNIGAEAEKGNDLHKEAYQLLEKAPINFQGNVEAREVITGVCDIVATDGFSGNIFLKSSEGAALAIMKRVKTKITEGVIAKFGAVLAYKKLNELKDEFNYETEGGAPILGLKYPVLKIHGNSKAGDVYYAVLRAIPYINNDVTGQIKKIISEL